jgi:hypothetical protein
MTNKTDNELDTPADRDALDAMVAKIELLRDGSDVGAKALHPSRDRAVARRLRQELGDNPDTWRVSDRLGNLILNHPLMRNPKDAAPDAPKKMRDVVKDMSPSERLEFVNRQSAIAALELKKKTRV